MSPRRIPALAIVADIVAVVVFAAIGRLSHAEPDDILGLLGTAAPFLVGLGAMWATRAVRTQPVGARAALTVWAGTVGIGLLIRALLAGYVPPASFIVISAVALAVLLLGWRALSALVSVRARQRALH